MFCPKTQWRVTEFLTMSLAQSKCNSIFILTIRTHRKAQWGFNNQSHRKRQEGSNGICECALEKTVGKSQGTRSWWASQVSGNGKPLMNFKSETDMIGLASSKWTLISEQTVLWDMWDHEWGDWLGDYCVKFKQNKIQTEPRTQIPDEGRSSKNIF